MQSNGSVSKIVMKRRSVSNKRLKSGVTGNWPSREDLAESHSDGKRPNRGCAWAGTETSRGATDNAAYRSRFLSSREGGSQPPYSCILRRMDLYDRLEELQGMTHLLIDDVAFLKPKCGELNPNVTDEEKATRRFYIRAVFALVEAFVEQHRRLLLELCESNKIELKEKTRKRLQEIKEVFRDDGTVEEQVQYLQIFDKIKEVYKAAGVGFGQRLSVTFGDRGWTTFKAAMEIRNRITHPKNVNDCWIFEDALKTVNDANDWFKKLQNEFVRVAREHRTANTREKWPSRR